MQRRILTYSAAVFILGVTVTPTNAQYHRATLRHGQTNKGVSAVINRIAAQYADSLRQLGQFYQTRWRYQKSDSLNNPYYFRLFSPATFHPAVVDRAFGWNLSATPANATDSLQTAIVCELMQAYVDNPQSFVLAHETPVPPASHEKVAPPLPPSKIFKEEKEHKTTDELTDNFSMPGDIEIVTFKPNFWHFGTNFSLQFTQAHVSDNWYKGGESNFSMLGTWNISANFDNKQKITFENLLEMKLGFQTSKSDKYHRFKTNSDLVRLTNKLGLKAVKNWYYTVMLQCWTQFHPGYKANEKPVKSDFMSPFDGVFSCGMDYKVSLKRFNTNVTISPFAVNLRYVDRKALETSFGLEEGKHTKYNFGSNITANYTWNIAKNIQWTSRFYYFTDYKKVQIEWENTFNLTINRYLSTKLFLYPRYDDSANREDGDSYFQFSEWLSFGLNLSF